MSLPVTPIFVRQGFALLTAAYHARQLAADYIADGKRKEAVRHIDRARFWIRMSTDRPGPRLP
jgi:hypothetical protein